MTVAMLPITEIVHVKCTRTDRVYRVLAYDAETGQALMQGKFQKFKNSYNPQVLKELGYTQIVGPFEGMIK